MSDFMRPAARAALWRWREVLAALAVATLGLWWGLNSFGVVRWLGVVLVVAAAGLGAAGVQRARFRQDGQGPGVVSLDERRLVYMGPLTGGAMDVADLTRLDLDPAARPAHWVLTGVGGQGLAIPVNADGAEVLFDVFAALPGIRSGELLAVLERTPGSRVTVWEKRRTLLH
ncbi:hypothetical protein SAMN04488003_103139 [Loktanella fryxellensis]|uniref:Uncharacterized protein n=1 Tax=Loktanella fryxellensis TaxID=245187 RepID=A0A1H8AEK3_9RHOB|nr:hypothetical protein [Loktanella fryxellensis]SEM69160.1 hypothetical protein SAMN04488003_103139 [Loktanella fryxellensis]